MYGHKQATNGLPQCVATKMPRIKDATHGIPHATNDSVKYVTNDIPYVTKDIAYVTKDTDTVWHMAYRSCATKDTLGMPTRCIQLVYPTNGILYRSYGTKRGRHKEREAQREGGTK